MRARTIFIQPAAPAKPATGSPCNGCGQCCAAAPCPLGIFLSRRRTDACAALLWDEAGRRYLCGALAAPKRWLPLLPRPAATWLARRWIAAGDGCDADIEAA